MTTLGQMVVDSTVTQADMEQFDHRDDWNVPCLYRHEAQILVDQKVAEAVRRVLEQQRSAKQ